MVAVAAVSGHRDVTRLHCECYFDVILTITSVAARSDCVLCLQRLFPVYKDFVLRLQRR